MRRPLVLLLAAGCADPRVPQNHTVDRVPVAYLFQRDDCTVWTWTDSAGVHYLASSFGSGYGFTSCAVSR